MRNKRRTVDRHYRAEIRSLYPRLFEPEGAALLRLYNHAWTTQNVNDLGLVITSEEVLREVDENDHRLNRDTFSREWIEWAKSIVPGIEFTKYGSSIGPRALLKMGFRPQTRAEQMSTDKVDWLTGRKAGDVLKEMNEDEETIESIWDAQDRLLDYLNNSLDNRCWASVKKRLRMGELYDLIPQLKAPKARTLAENSVNTIDFDIVPKYAPSDKEGTHRLFTKNNGWSWMPRMIRDFLLEGQVQCDLRMAHLAIAASDWGVEEALEILQTEDPWAELKRQTKIDDKDVLKPLIYSIVYGGERGQLALILMEKKYPADIRETLDHFTSVPVIKELLAKSGEAREKLIRNRGIEDAFGHWHPLMSDDEVKSLLALRSQSIEMALLLPALDIVRGRDKESRITLWLHDGFYLWTRMAKQGPKDAAKMKALVDAECRRRGIPTRLEVK